MNTPHSPPPQEILKDLPRNRARVLKNFRCAYCGQELVPAKKTRDHVVGRRFVPKGFFDGHWNLIVNACQSCNNAKSDLEDDIAAITLLPETAGHFRYKDSLVIEEAQRRAVRSRSRRTGKLIENSQEEITVKRTYTQDFSIALNMIAPPQIDDKRAFEMARFHLTGLFFMMCYNPETQEGGWWRGGFHPLELAPRRDWGNATLRGFMEATAGWTCHLFAVTADGFFKAVIRRHPLAECWSWALQWNHSLRLVGFFGERDPAQKLADDLPRPRSMGIFQSDVGRVRMREQVELAPVDDILFRPPPMETAE